MGPSQRLALSWSLMDTIPCSVGAYKIRTWEDAPLESEFLQCEKRSTLLFLSPLLQLGKAAFGEVL